MLLVVMTARSRSLRSVYSQMWVLRYGFLQMLYHKQMF